MKPCAETRYGLKMAALAKQENHRPKLPRGGSGPPLKEGTAYDVRKAQVLDALGDKEMTRKELSKLTKHKLPTLQDTLLRMVKDGLVISKPNPERWGWNFYKSVEK